MSKLRTAVAWLWEDIRVGMWALFVNKIAASALTPRHVRYVLYRICGIPVHTPSILPGTFFYGRNVRIGRGTFVNYRCFFEDHMAPIEIGENCSIAFEVLICTGAHPIGPAERRAGPVTSGAVRIGRGCWIGARAVILPGVTIGDGCVIAAGAVVTKDCEPNGVYGGVPAHRIRDLD